MLTSVIQIGHTPTDSARERRIKSIIALAMIGATLFPLQIIYFEDRTALELIFDWVAFVGTVGSLVVLQLGKRTDLAFIFVACVGLAVLAAALLVLGNRNGDPFLLPVVPVFAVALLGARRSIPWFAATLLIVLVVAADDAILPELASALHRSDVNPEGLLFHGPAKEPLTQEKLIGLLTGLTLIYLVVFSAHHALQQAHERIEGLLLNILPSSIAARLTDESRQKLREDGAGIIGRKKFIYDLWGDAVNVASRMESHGEPDTIQVSSGTQEVLEDTHDFESLGNIEIKGKGRLPAWRLIGPKV